MKCTAPSLRKYNLLSLFDGIGAFPLAFANTTKTDHTKLIYESSEIEHYLVDILNTNFPNVKQLGDITNIDWETPYHHTKLPDIITMGTPCTGFSTAGKRDGLENKESILFINGVDCIKKTQPKYFIWENVFGVLSNNKGQEFREVLKQFADIGYNVVWTTYDTKYFGLPQKRRRVYMIGVRNNLKQAKKLSAIDPFNFKLRMKSNPIVKAYEDYIKTFYSNYTNGDTFYFNRQRSDCFVAEGISSTLAKRDYKSYKDLIVYNNIIRRETPQERLRLQGMPSNWFDNTQIPHSDNLLFRANGMSLPVVESVFESLNHIDQYEFLKFFSQREAAEYTNILKAYTENSKLNSHQIVSSAKEILNKKGKNEGRIAYSGIMQAHKNGFEFFLFDECSESSFNSIYQFKEGKTEITSIFSIIDKNAHEKYNLTARAIDGILRREKESGKPIPTDLKLKIKAIYNK